MSINFNKMTGFLYLIVVLFLTRQMPLTTYSIVMNLALLAIAFIGFISLNVNDFFSSIERRVALITYCILIALFFYSIVIMHNDIIYAVKFFIIIFILISVHFIALNSVFLINVALYLNVIQAIVVTSISLYMSYYWSNGDYYFIREWFLINSFGDVYTHGNSYFRVQILGNNLIPFFYMVSYFMFNKSGLLKYKVSCIILLVGTIFAGNFMFLVSLSMFHFFMLIKKTRLLNPKYITGYSSIIQVLLAVFILPFAIISFLNVIESKSDGGNTSSVGIRYDQFDILIDDLSLDVSTVVLGKGLGNTIDIKTESRDYKDRLYYELQSIYILNQLGFIPFLLLLLVLYYLFNNNIRDKNMWVLYVCYIIYAISNPYIFDTNHAVVILTLISLSKLNWSGDINN